MLERAQKINRELQQETEIQHKQEVDNIISIIAKKIKEAREKKEGFIKVEQGLIKNKPEIRTYIETMGYAICYNWYRGAYYIGWTKDGIKEIKLSLLNPIGLYTLMAINIVVLWYTNYKRGTDSMSLYFVCIVLILVILCLLGLLIKNYFLLKPIKTSEDNVNSQN